MKKVIRYGVGAALAGALTLGPAWAQQSSDPTGRPGAGTGAGSPDSVGKGDTGRTSDSAGGGAKSSDRPSGMTGSTGSSGTATGASAAAQKVDKKLQERLEKIHAGNQAELELAQLGARSAQSPEVKQLAEQMQTDHQQLDQQLTQQAQTMGVSLEGKTFQKESKSAQDEMKKMQSKTGQDFDKAFMDRIVKGHEKNLKEVKDGAKDAEKGKHTELASTLQTAQTTIQQHLDHAKQVQKSLGGSAASGSRGSSTMGTGSAGESRPSTSGAPGETQSPGSSGRDSTGGATPGRGERGSSTDNVGK